MAWTAPRTWVDGEFVTAAIMNPHIRDNQLSEDEHLIVRKPTDQTNSTTTLANDTALVLPVGASDVWKFEFFVSVQSSDNWKFALTFPASGQVKGFYNESGGAKIIEGSASPTTTYTVVTWQTGLGSYFMISGLYVGGGTAGNVTLQWACATAVSCVVRANSTLWGVKLA